MSGNLFPSPHIRYGPEVPEHWSPWRRTGKENFYEKLQQPKMPEVCGKQLCGYSRQDTGATDINWRVALKLKVIHPFPYPRWVALCCKQNPGREGGASQVPRGRLLQQPAPITTPKRTARADTSFTRWTERQLVDSIQLWAMFLIASDTFTDPLKLYL